MYTQCRERPGCFPVPKQAAGVTNCKCRQRCGRQRRASSWQLGYADDPLTSAMPPKRCKVGNSTVWGTRRHEQTDRRTDRRWSLGKGNCISMLLVWPQLIAVAATPPVGEQIKIQNQMCGLA